MISRSVRTYDADMNDLPASAANRLGLDYRADAATLGPPAVPIVDAHSHINGTDAVDVYREAMEAYGVSTVWSMTALEGLAEVRRRLDGRIEPIAMPDFHAEDRRHAHGEGYLDRIRGYRDQGTRIVKFWCAPRIVDMADDAGIAGTLGLDGPVRRTGMELAVELGMAIMVHVADPDTWFATKYADASRYGTKEDQYVALDRVLQDYRVPFIAAHLGGFPENLDFLADLLDRHPHLHLDASATKWIVREVSKHEPAAVRGFLHRYRERILFGSDIVTLDDHLRREGEGATEMTSKAGSREEAFDLYASRYWALRTLWETAYDGESPIADPDLAMTDPDRYTPLDAPRLRGVEVSTDDLRWFYRDAASRFLDALPPA